MSFRSDSHHLDVFCLFSFDNNYTHMHTFILGGSLPPIQYLKREQIFLVFQLVVIYVSLNTYKKKKQRTVIEKAKQQENQRTFSFAITFARNSKIEISLHFSPFFLQVARALFLIHVVISSVFVHRWLCSGK